MVVRIRGLASTAAPSGGLVAIKFEYIGQPSTGHVMHTLGTHIDSGHYQVMNAAIAYVTVGGVRSLMDRADPVALGALQKKWLVGIDWFRTDPDALDALASLADSEVRVHDGQVVVGRAGCLPRVSFHPKTFMLSGRNRAALLGGSANASANGLHRGIEANILIAVGPPVQGGDAEAMGAIDSGFNWFDSLWSLATPWAAIAADYRRVHAEQRAHRPPLTDDDAGASTRIDAQRGFSGSDLARLRSSTHFWIQAGNLHANRGPGVPGNQLMLRALTRVYFGFPPDDVPTDSHIGTIEISVGGVSHPDRTLRYSNNAMDVLGLPVPGAATAPTAYDGETLVFARESTNSSTRFTLRLARTGEFAGLRRASKRAQTSWRMSSGREFGAY